VFAYELQQEAEARGEVLLPAARLHIGEPSFRTPEHIRLAAIDALHTETITYGPAAGWPWLRELIAEKIERVNGYHVNPQQVAIAMGGTGAIQSALIATVGVGDEVLIPDPHWPHYTIQLACCGATPVSLIGHDQFNQGRVICIYTSSKTYAMTGWRIVYLATGTQLLQTITYVLDASYTNISTIIQRAAAAALTGPQACVIEMRQV